MFPADDDGTPSPCIARTEAGSAAEPAKRRHAGIRRGRGDRRDRRELLDDLRGAIDDPGQLRLEYQPRIDLQSSRCVGAEALLRWRHPSLGLLPPGEFIPLVEDQALIVPLTDWVMDHVMGFAAGAFVAGLRDTDPEFRLSVNIAPLNLTEGYFIGRLVEAIGRHGIDPARLELEFTEGTAINDSARTRRQLQQIRRLGMRVCIDDFGAGYSNLTYFKRVPADLIKIDRALIAVIGDDQASDTIVKWIIGLAHELRLRVVAEGIDNSQKAAALSRWGCDEGQGYAFAKPMAGARLAGWIAHYNALADADGRVVRTRLFQSWR